LSRPDATDHVLLDIRVQPGAREDRVIGRSDGRLRIKIHAKAREGEANEALLRFLSKRLGVARSQLRIVSGERSREKRVRVEAVAPSEVERRLEAILEGKG
jgi:uncharacterized protein (TIGR00251 family)